MTAGNVINEKHYKNLSNVETHSFVPNQTIKFSEIKPCGFDFSMKVPSSTKNS